MKVFTWFLLKIILLAVIAGGLFCAGIGIAAGVKKTTFRTEWNDLFQPTVQEEVKETEKENKIETEQALIRFNF